MTNTKSILKVSEESRKTLSVTFTHAHTHTHPHTTGGILEIKDTPVREGLLYRFGFNTPSEGKGGEGRGEEGGGEEVGPVFMTYRQAAAAVLGTVVSVRIVCVSACVMWV